MKGGNYLSLIKVNSTCMCFGIYFFDTQRSATLSLWSLFVFLIGLLIKTVIEPPRKGDMFYEKCDM